MALSEEIDYIQCYVSRRLLYHGYIYPFIFLHLAWAYMWIVVYGVNDNFEIGCIAVAAILIVQTLLWLSTVWSVHLRAFLTCTGVGDPYNATVVKVVPTANNGSPEIVPIVREDGRLSFIFQRLRYVHQADRFHPVCYPIGLRTRHFHDWRGYQTDEQIKSIASEYGCNQMEMVIPEFKELFLERATAPFFVFQVFCVGLWCLDEFWYYSLFTLCMLVVFECTLVQQQLRNMGEIRKMGNRPHLVSVFRCRRWSQLMSDQLVPGDLVSLVRDYVPCDVLLLAGGCVVDESMLTGESVPQLKEPLGREEHSESMGRDENNELFERDDNSVSASSNEHNEPTLDESQHGRLHIVYGGTRVVQHNPPSKGCPGIRPTDGGCLGYVLRVGFNTSQGRLLRTILFAVKRVTANNLETFLFILFLLVFAVVAAAYVWVKGTENPDRNRYKLLLECSLILTSVVPPELPIELSLAVNNSLVALSKLGIYCTEPFRIPFAGKVDICCFDKTGTLTSDQLEVQGIAGLQDDPECYETLTPVNQCPIETVQVLAGCHSLSQLESNEGIIGDPLEKVALEAVGWTLTKNDTLIPPKHRPLGATPLRIAQRFHFSSSLRRMSVVFSQESPSSHDLVYTVAVKGAPEVVKPMLVAPPRGYDVIYTRLTRQGARVLALASRRLGPLPAGRARQLTRSDTESGLQFVGFIAISCPMKPDSLSAVRELKTASHRVAMITGDNALTACHVARELGVTNRERTAWLVGGTGGWRWESMEEGDTSSCFTPPNPPSDYDLCLTGDSLTYLDTHHPSHVDAILPKVSVFARTAPKQKEMVVTRLRARGCVVLMCGDGTNDVGALKHAHVGVALLSVVSATARKTGKPGKKQPETTRVPAAGNKPRSRAARNLEINGLTQRPTGRGSAQLSGLMKELEAEDAASVVRLGDASIASPFTSKKPSVESVCHIIKQGRCTLVTTLQMFKILALNALIFAYSQSVLYLDGIKFNDAQATLQGLLLAGCFLFVSRCKPLVSLSPRRPLPDIFNAYTLLTVAAQFAVHFSSLIHLVDRAHQLDPKGDEPVDLEAEFEPNLVNSTVYIIAMSMQVATFAVNYKGHPFMQSLTENKPLLYSILGTLLALLLLATSAVPEFNEYFQIVEFPAEHSFEIVQVVVADFIICLAIDRSLDWFLGYAKLRSY